MIRTNRSRLTPHDVRPFLRAERRQMPGRDGLNRRAHARRHGANVLYYTTKGTLDTNPGTPLHALRGRRIVGVRLNCAGAPTGTLEGDVLLDGVSIFSVMGTTPKIATGQLYGYRAPVFWGSIPADGKVQCKIVTVAGATGPVVFEIEYL
jgi:hypothetical protein